MRGWILSRWLLFSHMYELIHLPSFHLKLQPSLYSPLYNISQKLIHNKNKRNEEKQKILRKILKDIFHNVCQIYILSPHLKGFISSPSSPCDYAWNMFQMCIWYHFSSTSVVFLRWLRWKDFRVFLGSFFFETC